MSPIPIDRVDLDSLVLARNDPDPDSTWYFDPRSGESLYFGLDDDADLPALATGQHVVIPTQPQPATDIDDFIDRIDDESLAATLYGQFHQRRGRRRFLDAVSASASAHEWQEFTMRRECIRAIDWLLERGLVEASGATDLRAELTGDR